MGLISRIPPGLQRDDSDGNGGEGYGQWLLAPWQNSREYQPAAVHDRRSA